MSGGIYAHIAGIDIVRNDEAREFRRARRTTRRPLGRSYMLENRR